VVTETIPISDIAKIKKASLKKMSKTSKILIGTAVAFGILVTAALASCAAATYSERQMAQQ
jgi:cell division protein FtsL